MSAAAQLPAWLDETWLTERLSAGTPGTVVTDIQVVSMHRGTNTAARLRLTFEHESTLPSRVFVKVPPENPLRRAAVNRTGMGVREARFYQQLAHQVPLRVPAAYVAHYDLSDGAFALVLEDLTASGCTLPDPVVGVDDTFAYRAMERYADLHVHFEDPAVRSATAGWVEPARKGSSYGRAMLQSALDLHRDRLTPSFAELAQLYVTRQADLQELWSQGPHTVLQGDGHVGNLFDDGGEPGWADWGLINLGPPMRDVSYFIIMALSPDNRARLERDLIARYLARRAEVGGTALHHDDAWRQHRVQAAYAVPASCQIVQFPEDIDHERRQFSQAFLHRAERAIDELESRSAIADAGL